jgi:uncharacterized protein YaiI (UPF0178 family)
MKILVDADAYPAAIKDILYRTAERVKIHVTMVANQKMRTPESEYISSVSTPSGPDAADDWIVENIQKGDLVITADIPLADRVVDKDAYAISPRGKLFSKDNIKQSLSMRDFMHELRNEGMVTGGPSAFTQKNRQDFANQLDRFLTKHFKNQN